MAILDFLTKDKDTHKDEDFTPKSNVSRGSGGRFVSKKKPESSEEKSQINSEILSPEKSSEKKEQDESKAYGPLLAPFGGKEIRKFYLSGKWYFSVEDLVSLLYSSPPFRPYKELKYEKKFKEIFDQNLIVLKEIECMDLEDSVALLREIIRTFNAQFPGSLFSWLEDISKFEYEEDPLDQSDKG